MEIAIIITAIVLFVSLYLLKDTITEKLSNGKSFAPAELKSFR